VRRGARGAALLVALGIAASAGAQPEAPPGTGDVPAGDGVVVGQVVHSVSGDPVPDVDVILYAIASSGQPGVRRTTTDPAGAFRFEGIATGGGVTYLLGARHEQVPFVGERVVFEAGATRREVELRVAGRTRDPGAVAVEEARLRLTRTGDEIAVAEIYRLRNDGEDVFYATSSERGADAAPALRALLPEEARGFGLPYALEPEGVVHEGRDVRFFGPVYPGEQEIAFTYTVPAREGESTLRKRWPSGAERVRVLYPTGAMAVQAEGLAESEPETVEGEPHRVLEAGPLGRGAELALTLDVPRARRDPDALALARYRSFLEVDAEAVLVSEEYHLEVEGDAPVLGPEDEPLLRIPVPRDARDLRFGASASPAGIRFEQGALAIQGPLPPGPSRVDLRYRLPAESSRVDLERRFERRVPVVDVYIADTGLVVESERLHRRRPVKAPNERVYMHFEAFHVAPDERVDVALRPLPPRTRLQGAGRAAFVIAAALVVALFLSGPLRRKEGEAAMAGAEADPAQTAREEREAIYTALRDLEHDFETGKLAPEDYGPMREELRRRAAGMLRAERMAEAAAAAPAEPDAAGREGEPSARRCPGCDAETGPEARFCSRCGRPLEARAGARG